MDHASSFARPPFFVLGCVRSGTTMLRQILERHPALVCPEETHLFRWPHPFGTPDYRNAVLGNATLRRHRELDGISEDEFAAMLDRAPTRRALTEAYMAAYRARRKPEAARWFEKSPQNVYGLQTIHGLFPEARFLHIVRHPLEVAASLKLGKIVKVASPVGAANYWLEAVLALARLRESVPGRVWQVRYEDFTAAPLAHLRALFAFLAEPFDEAPFAGLALDAKSHAGQGVLTAGEIARIWEICGETASGLGYEPWPAPAPDAPAPADGPTDGPTDGEAAAGAVPAEEPGAVRPADGAPAGPERAGGDSGSQPATGHKTVGRETVKPATAGHETGSRDPAAAGQGAA